MDDRSRGRSDDQRDGSDRTEGAPIKRRHWLTGIAVVVLIVIIEMVPQLLSARAHTGTRLVYWLFETSLVVVALSLHHHWGMRRRVTTSRMMVVSLAISATIGAACAMLFLLVTTLRLAVAPRSLSSLRSVLAYGVVLGLVQCGVWALGFIYPFATEDARLRALETEKLQLETEKLKLEADTLRAAAELSRLRAQLQPHFLLNTLNAIAGLVTAQPREARRLVACLGDLLRDSLRDASEMQTLDEEITWLRRYAEILEARHSGMLSFNWSIADEAKSILVPRLLLQPIVENAVNHGALHRASGGGEVVVRAALADGEGNPSLAIVIEDNGPGFSTDAPPRSGAFGLHSVRRRLELRYESASFAVTSSPEGTRCTVTVPCDVGAERPRLAEAS